MSAGATDGKYFRAAGSPRTASRSSSERNEDFAHGLNERIRGDQFYNSLEDWHALIEDVAGKKSK